MHACMAGRQGPSQAAARDGKTRGLVGGLRDVFSVHVPHEQGGGETEEIAAGSDASGSGSLARLRRRRRSGPALAACSMQDDILIDVHVHATFFSTVVRLILDRPDMRCAESSAVRTLPVLIAG